MGSESPRSKFSCPSKSRLCQLDPFFQSEFMDFDPECSGSLHGIPFMYVNKITTCTLSFVIDF